MPVNWRSVIGHTLFIFAISGPVSAQQVYKCVQDKDVVYQSQPCDTGQTAEKAWDARGHAPPSNAEQWRVYNTIQATRQRDAQLRAGGSSASASVPSTIGRCDAAKRTRDKALYDAGPRVSIEGRRSWDAYVAAACK